MTGIHGFFGFQLGLECLRGVRECSCGLEVAFCFVTLALWGIVLLSP